MTAIQHLEAAREQFQSTDLRILDLTLRQINLIHFHSGQHPTLSRGAWEDFPELQDDRILVHGRNVYAVRRLQKFEGHPMMSNKMINWVGSTDLVSVL